MLKNRIARLERRRPPGRSGVVRCKLGETVADAAQRADREGYVGALVVPALLDRDAWEQAATEQQARAVAEQGRFIAEHRVTPDAPPVVRPRTDASPQPAPQAKPRRPSATVPLGRK